MISINIDERIEDIYKQYLIYLTDFLNYKQKSTSPKAKKLYRDKILKIHSGKRNLTSKMFLYFHTHIYKIVDLKPDELKDYYKSQFINDITINFKSNDSQHKIFIERFKIGMVTLYDNFMKHKIWVNGELITVGRWLSRSLDVKVCPYCNHNYTFTINDIKNNVVSRPQFDHFLPKSKYPLFSLSFYNLVPSCGVCNSIKGEKEISYSPYDNLRTEKMTFSLSDGSASGSSKLKDWLTDEKKIKIFLKSPENCTNASAMGISHVYDNHIDYVSEMLHKVHAYQKDYYTAMINDFRGLGKSHAEIDRIIFGAYLDQNEKRPLSKLTKDILDELNFR